MSRTAARLDQSSALPEPAGAGAPGILTRVESPPASQPVTQGAAPAPNPEAPGAAPAGVLETRELARRVRAAKVLTPALKRYWLAVLPHLTAADRAQLDAILRRAAPPASTTPAGHTRSDGRRPSGALGSTVPASEA